MQTGHIASFGAGVLLALGIAWLSSSGSPAEVEAPVAATAEAPRPSGGAAVEGAPARVAVPVGDDDAEARIAALEQAIAELSFERDALRGQVAAAGGEPIPWPDDLAAGLGPDGFAATLRDILAESDVEVAEVDCSEYPCIALLDLGPTDDPMDAAKDMAHILREGAEDLLGTDELGLGLRVEVDDDGEGGPSRLQVGVSLGHEDVDPREPRLATRMSDLVQD